MDVTRKSLRKDLRAVTPSPNPMWWWRGLYLYASLDGTIAFDYGAKTLRFGAGVDEAEAKTIIKTIEDFYNEPKQT
jgi:hypothetical protein